MTRDQLEAHYRRYIQCLNERRLDQMDQFYADELLYNGRRMTRAEWQAQAIEASFRAIPDLQWHIQHLVIEGGAIAARLQDTGTIRLAFLGLMPSEQPVQFGEHVFYRFSGGLATEVWSIADVEATRRPIHG